MNNTPVRFAKIILFIGILFFSHTPSLWAQTGEVTEPPAEPSGGLPAEISREDSVIDLDIRTSTLTELASWSRSLGLSEGGTREDLARRLRDHFRVADQSAAGKEEGGKKVITIESARSTEYFTLDVVDEEYARLRGDVIVSLKDGEALHRITAREILYNRTRNLLTASGGVKYVKEDGGTIETFSGDNITVNLDNWASIFMDGVSEKSLQDNETAYRFSGTVISRTDEDVTVLTNAEITNAANPEALWSLKAGKLWLLPGADFAILNAVLKVGEIPVLYIPFFYWPADEVVFHPVLGMRSREGAFVQTTTYILGRPKVSSTSENSLTKILGNSNDMKKVPEGLFLRSTGKKEVDPNEISLKAMIDYYTNLGVYLGTDLTLPRKGVLSSLDFSLGIGFTRDVIKVGDGLYTPFAPNYDGTSEWNESMLFSLEVPLRYRLETNGALGGKYGSFSWKIPFYSDPYVNRDFLNRSETMDWVRMMQDGAAGMEKDETTDTGLGSYQWQLNGSVTPTLPEVLRPYISTLTLSSFTSTMDFGKRPSAGKYKNDYSPNRDFFFPNKFTMYSMSLSITGTPLTLGSTTQAAPVTKPPPEDDPFRNIGVPRSPWGEAAAEETRSAANTTDLVPPALAQRFEIKRAGLPKFTIDYRIAPTAASELQFRNNHWKEAEDIDWSEVSSVLTNIRGDASTSFMLTDPNGAYSSTFRLSGTGAWKDYTYIAEEVIAAVTPQAFRNAGANKDSYFSTSYEFSTTLKPLYFSSVWGNSNIQYTLGGLVAKSVFKNNSGEPGSPTMQAEPEWDVKYGAWEKDYLDRHQFVVNINANVMDKAQSFTLTAELPPREVKLTGTATLRAWITETSLGMDVVEPADLDKRKLGNFTLKETFNFWKYGSLSQNMVFNSEEEEFSTLETKLSLWGFSFSYAAIRSVPYEFEAGTGWIQKGEPTLHSRDLIFGYAQKFKKENLWKNRLSFSVDVNTNMTFDLDRYTYSRLSFGLGFTLGISKFIDISFSASSENAVMYRYFKDIPGFQIPIEMPDGDQNNFFLDLFNSFRFDDENLRKSSGFKLKNLKLDVTHHLGDWNAKLGMTLSPYLEQPAGGTPYYKFNTDLSFVVQWIPISEIKTDMKLNKEEWTVK